MANWGLNVVKQYERIVVFKWGKYTEIRMPGVRWLWPIVNNGSKTVDLREVPVIIPRQTNITKDNAPIDIDFFVYMRIMEDRPQDTILNIENFGLAAQALAMTSLRAVIGEMPLDDVLSKRDQINAQMQLKLDEVTANWGVKVTRVEIKEVEPPRDVQDAMNRQLSAERNGRAAVTEAEGQRDAQINVAEGDKQAAVLRATGNRAATILEAEGDRQAQILRAQGFSEGMERINQAAMVADPRTMSLQYFDTLKELGASASTKFIFPMEFTSMLQSFMQRAGYGESDEKAGS
ncbi:MAG: SPFH/Band 7/PHB domain protein [Chloroflexi bacterium]|nr:SPFH/Band 7/PHB domain protein [Chloroflexota bacterium]